MLLIVSLPRVAKPLKLGEIAEWMQGISPDITPKDLQRYLSMLQSLELIERHRYGHVEYYANIRNLSFVD
jgi:DNA-binding HxlR family transcriptional regulator